MTKSIPQKVFITRAIPDAAVKLLKDKGYKVSVYPKDSPITPKELYENIEDADAIISLLSDKIDASLINKMDKCKIIANYAVGYYAHVIADSLLSGALTT